MAVILKTPYSQNIFYQEIEKSSEPLLYVDTTNKEGFITTIYELCMGLSIRNNTDCCKLIGELKRESYVAENLNDIRYKKEDGLWMIPNEKNMEITMYERRTAKGVFYTTSYVTKLFTISYKECEKFWRRALRRRREGAERRLRRVPPRLPQHSATAAAWAA